MIHHRGLAGRRGGALLAVLWLTAALSAIVFTLSITVRGELERAGTAADSARAYYMAQGAIERFLLHLSWGRVTDPRNSPALFQPGQRRLRWDLPAGVVDLEITGENGKLSVYSAPPIALARLFASLGVEEAKAMQIAGGIAGRRQGPMNLGSGSSFSAQGPSFLQLEDLLTVSGMTPDIFYGWWERDGEGRLVERGGVARHVTVLDDAFLNVNYASPAVLRAIGLPEGAVIETLQARERQIIQDASPMNAALSGLGARVVLVGGGSRAYTVRATAQLKDRPVRRSVAALVRLGRNRTEPDVGVARWYQTAN